MGSHLPRLMQLVRGRTGLSDSKSYVLLIFCLFILVPLKCFLRKCYAMKDGQCSFLFSMQLFLPPKAVASSEMTTL